MTAKKAAPKKAATEDVEASPTPEKRTTAPSGDGPQVDHPEVVAANKAHGVGKD